MAQAVSDKPPHSKEACCADFNKDIQEKRHKRRSKPQPWILLKFAVSLTLGIIGFATYVYVDRFCVPILTRKPEAMGNRVFGSQFLFGKRLGMEEVALTLSRHITVVFLAVFGILLIMMLWTYAKVGVAALQSCVSSHALQVCFTSPGFAKDVRDAMPTYLHVSCRMLMRNPLACATYTPPRNVRHIRYRWTAVSKRFFLGFPYPTYPGPTALHSSGRVRILK